jgi:hypothetical protein
MAIDMQMIWVGSEPEYFCEKGWTGDSPYGPSGKITRFRSDFARGRILMNRLNRFL